MRVNLGPEDLKLENRRKRMLPKKITANMFNPAVQLLLENFASIIEKATFRVGRKSYKVAF